MAAEQSYLSKLRRARTHLDALDKQIRTWIDGEPYGVIDEPDPEPPLQEPFNGAVARRFRVIRADNIPSDFSLLIGDCLFNLRSALDHLALALANANSRKLGITMTPKQIEGSEFPVFYSDASFASFEKKKIGCIDSVAQRVIKAMQPYHGGNSYALHPLWQIHEINRIDKHRTLAVCAAETKKDGIRQIGWLHDPSIIESLQYGLAGSPLNLELNIVLLRYIGVPCNPHRNEGLKPQLSLEVLFGQGELLAGKSVVPSIQLLLDHVSDIVAPQLAKFL